MDMYVYYEFEKLVLGLLVVEETFHYSMEKRYRFAGLVLEDAYQTSVAIKLQHYRIKINGEFNPFCMHIKL